MNKENMHPDQLLKPSSITYSRKIPSILRRKRRTYNEPVLQRNAQEIRTLLNCRALQQLSAPKGQTLTKSKMDNHDKTLNNSTKTDHDTLLHCTNHKLRLAQKREYDLLMADYQRKRLRGTGPVALKKRRDMRKPPTGKTSGILIGRERESVHGRRARKPDVARRLLHLVEGTTQVLNYLSERVDDPQL